MDLNDRLEELAGGTLDELRADPTHLRDWSSVARGGTRAAFEHRLVLGLALWGARPRGHGDVAAWQEEWARTLGRSARWIRRTVQVAGVVRDAVDDGMRLPLAMREVSWKLVPMAVENVREGRALDWRPALPNQGAQPVAARFHTGVQVLVNLLAELEDAGERRRLADVGIAALQAAGQGAAVLEPDRSPAPLPTGEGPNPSGGRGPSRGGGNGRRVGGRGGGRGRGG